MATLSHCMSICFAVCLLASSFPGAASQYHGLPDSETDMIEAVAQALSPESAAMYRRSVSKDLPILEASLAPTIAALPRKESGTLDSLAVRYALHRLFVQQHAWYVQGLDPAGQAWNSSASPSDMTLLKQMPIAVRELIAQRLNQGLNAHEVVVLAATIEFLLHNVAFRKLNAAYDVLGLSLGSATKDHALQAVDLYMASYILGADIAKTSRTKMLKAFASIEKVYPTWNETRSFIHAIALQHTEASTGMVTVMQVRDTVEDIDEKYGRWQNRECLALKNQLVKMEDHGTGRVKMADFYSKALGGSWQFTESVPYLRKIGALDEINPSNPRVIIPNYVNSLSNCIGASSYHSLCCISECESLMDAVEAGLGKAEATPEEIRLIVEALPSATVPANRSLSQLLMVRLSAIANEHSSAQVPIHGRLFAQWMHHAYPRECSYPHLAGSTKPTSVYQQMHHTDVSMVASAEQMKSKTTRKPSRHDAPVESAPWIQQEELIFTAHDTRPPAWALLHGATAAAAIFTLAIGLCRMARASVRSRSLRATTAKGSILDEPAFAV